MDYTIFELRFLRKVILAPSGRNNVNVVYLPPIPVLSRYMNSYTNLNGMDPNMYVRKLWSLRIPRPVALWTKPRLIRRCARDVNRSLFSWGKREEDYQNITEEQIQVLMHTMNFLLHYDIEMFEDSRSNTMDVLLQLIVVLLLSNKKSECEVWVMKHNIMSKLIAYRDSHDGSSVLHRALRIQVGSFDIEPIVKLFVEEGNMDVNIRNNRRETPFHCLSTGGLVRWICAIWIPECVMKVAEYLKNKGAHMDSADINGTEASHFFSERSPWFSFNFNLQCLAAKAILKHGIRNEIRAPAKIIPFIELHKPGSL